MQRLIWRRSCLLWDWQEDGGEGLQHLLPSFSCDDFLALLSWRRVMFLIKKKKKSCTSPILCLFSGVFFFFFFLFSGQMF